MLVSMVFLVACGVGDGVESNQGELEKEKENDREIVIEKGDVLVRSEEYDIDLVKVEKSYDEEKGEQVLVTIDIKNKTNGSLDFYIMDAYSEGELLTYESIYFSQIVQSKGEEKGIVEINSYEGEYDLPKLEEDLELDIMAIDEDGMTKDVHKMEINFNN